MKKPFSVFYVNGKFLEEKQAKISVLDIGLLRGYGVFDFLVTYNNRPFLLKNHIRRLFNSAHLIGLEIGMTQDKVEKIVLNTIARNDKGYEKNIRIVVTGGVGINSLKPSKNPTIIVTVQPKHNYPQEYYSKGVKIITYNYERPLSDAKSLDYSIGIKALSIASKKNAIEALYVNNENFITEATTSNIFIVKKKKIYTPKNNILDGITRSLVIKLCGSTNPVHEKDIKLSDLLSADEAFITASNKEVMPIIKIDNKKIGSGKVGNVTRWVMETFKDFVHQKMY